MGREYAMPPGLAASPEVPRPNGPEIRRAVSRRAIEDRRGREAKAAAEDQAAGQGRQFREDARVSASGANQNG